MTTTFSYEEALKLIKNRKASVKAERSIAFINKDEKTFNECSVRLSELWKLQNEITYRMYQNN